MKVVRLTLSAPRTFVWEEETLPPPGPGEVWVRTRLSAVSVGSELGMVEGRSPAQVYPCPLGYQTLGVVEAVGEGMALAPGTRVVTTLGHASGGRPSPRTSAPRRLRCGLRVQRLSARLHGTAGAPAARGTGLRAVGRELGRAGPSAYLSCAQVDRDGLQRRGGLRHLCPWLWDHADPLLERLFAVTVTPEELPGTFERLRTLPRPVSLAADWTVVE